MELGHDSESSTRRKRLFLAQAILSLLLTGVIVVEFWSAVEDIFRAVVAPFGGVVLILFVLHLFHEPIEDFPEGQYGARALLVSLGVVLAAGVLVQLALVPLLGKSGLGRLLFFGSFFASLEVFLALRIRNLTGMSILTGFAEGIVIYLLFLNG